MRSPSIHQVHVTIIKCIKIIYTILPACSDGACMCSVAKAWLQGFLAVVKEDRGSTEVPSSDHTTTRFPRENVVASTAYKDVYVYTFCNANCMAHGSPGNQCCMAIAKALAAI